MTGSVQLVAGSSVVRSTLVDLISSQLPGTLAAFRQEHGLKLTELPPPVAVHPYEADTLDVLPVIAMAVNRVNDWRRVATEPGAEDIFEVKYQVRVFAWVKFKEREPVQKIRDDYATCLASVLLSNQSLVAAADAPPGRSGESRFRFNERTLDLSFSDTARARGDRWVAGCSVAFDVYHQESLRRVPFGTADTVTVETMVLPRHPVEE